MVRERLMTVAEVAEYVSCSVSTVRRLAARGAIPHYRLGKMVRFRRSDVEGWLALHREGALPDEAPRVALTNPNQLSLFAAE
jgi:excisionase family DNA binding protein